MVPIPPIGVDVALHSSSAELKYTHSKHSIDLLAKDEDIRRLRVDIRILEDVNEELHEQLEHEENRSDAFQKMVDENLLRAEDAEATLHEVEEGLRMRDQESQKLQAENQALRSASQVSSTVLAEKLALTRELGALKPELDYLKAQAGTVEQLMSEKLTLMRQLAEVQCEAENAKREAKRAQAKRRNTCMEIAQEEQVEDLKKQLAKEKRARQRAEEAADQVQGDMDVGDIRRELAREKKLRERAEEELEVARENTQVEDVRRDLLKEKKAKQKLEDHVESLEGEIEREKKVAARAAKRAEGNEGADDVAEELRQELAKEKRARTQAEHKASKAAEEWEVDRSDLNDKLNQFRKKLRDTKEELKSIKSELTTANENIATSNAAAALAATAAVPSKKPTTKAASKKRAATAMDPSADETTLGTPGNGPAVKRGRKAGFGEKSSFSITPFLNRTSAINVEDDEEEKVPSDVEASPAAKTTQTKRPLAPAASIKANSQPKKQPREKNSKLALAVVTEEEEPASQDVGTAKQNTSNEDKTAKIKVKDCDGPDVASKKAGAKVKPKMRKSLAEFKSFLAGDDEPIVKQKKRKLGGTGRTLFDAEEEAAHADGAKTGFGGRGLFGTNAYARLATKKAGVGNKSSRLGRSVLLSTADASGFQFSPLKRSRKNLDDTLRG